MEKKRTNQRLLDFNMVARALPEGEEAPEKSYIVEGKAVSFNSPTVLFEIEGNEYREQIDAQAFAEANMSDVIFNMNHEGIVMARTRNKTLQLDIREDGLYITADLGGTQAGRDLYESIQGGYMDRMSFQFTIAEESFDKTERMWTVRKIKRLYDVSAVSIPAYDDTSIEARKTCVLESLRAQEAREREAAASLAKRKLRTKLMLLNMED